MATYAIGDVQGCFATLERLLERIGADPVRDRLLLVGDLVNRGPGSAEVLRWAMRNQDWISTVLGNHDLHLIARHLGAAARKRRDTLDDVLDAPDRAALVEWLRAQPLALAAGGHLVVHAGLPPAWTADDALRLGAEGSAALRGPEAARLLGELARRPGLRFDESLGGVDRFCAVVQALTQLRTCRPDGTPCLDFSGRPADAPAGCRPWFDAPGCRERERTVVFGHWSALGLHRSARAICLDSGAVWGGGLAALRLDDGALLLQPTEPGDAVGRS